MAKSTATALLLVFLALGTSAVAQTPATRPAPELAPIQRVKVPDLSGLDPAAAGRLLSTSKLRLGGTGTVTVTSSARPVGTVVSQKPAPGTWVQTGSAVDVWIAKAPARDDIGAGPAPEQRVPVPNVIGLPVSGAQGRIAQAGLRTAKIEPRASTEPRGTVLEQVPGAGALVRRGQPVDLRTSDGSLTVVPNLRGALPGEADVRLRAQGLRLVGSSERESDSAVGRIIEQSPGAGAAVKRGTGVTIVVARAAPAGPSPDDRVHVPDLRGQDLSAARQVLGGLKLRLGNTGTRVSSADRVGTVIEQDPAPDTRVARGSAVNIWIAEAGPVTKPPPPEQLVVPNVVGLAIQPAQQTLSQAGLQPRETALQASVEPRGTVLAQLPRAGALVPRGTPVDLRTSDGSLTVVPDLRGRSRPEADTLLQARGLSVSESTERQAGIEPGRIVGHSPSPGARVPRGSGVSIIVARASTVVVPDLLGVPLPEARSRLEVDGLTVGGASSGPAEQPVGTVLTQDPPAGRAVPVGTAVQLTVSDGTLTRVPDLAGLTESAARDRLRELGLAPGERADEESPRSLGKVVRQALAPATLVARGTRVDYAVAAPQTREVPGVTGLSVGEAAARLGAVGLTLTEAARRRDSAAEGTVIAQRPGPPARVPIGAAVTVEVSLGPGFGTLGLVLGIGAVLAAVSVAAVKVARAGSPTDAPRISVTARVVVPEVAARPHGPLEVAAPVVRIRVRLETGRASVSADRLVVRSERGNS